MSDQQIINREKVQKSLQRIQNRELASAWATWSEFTQWLRSVQDIGRIVAEKHERHIKNAAMSHAVGLYVS